MRKVLTWFVALFMTMVAPAAAAETTSSTTITTTAETTTTTDGTTTDPADSTAPTDTTVGEDDGEHQDDQDQDEDKEDEDKEDGKGKGKKKGHQKKHENKYKGIERALESLLKNLEDGKGAPSDEALKAVIAKLTAMLKEDGTAPTDEVAEEAVEEKIETDIEGGTATESEVEVLVTIQIKGKKVDKAKENVESLLSANPKSDKLYELLSKVYKEKGDTKDVKVYVKGKKPRFDAMPYVKEGRTMVPVRAIVDALGAEVNWKAETQTVIIKKDGKTIELPIGSAEIKVNGQVKKIDKAAEITGARTMVPVRFISEFLGQEVQWDAQSSMVIVK
ncbi:copper amine oxidase N-terminal domain-containing protein [Effusibacillus consociatus]|uniref:Copper amine oxidase N-terminal domain-containing protein n=1 Tax=Effusibacillus consociatus TaxID=1117041 RepID=A0ABV9Q6Y4_9BACL